jgi:tight adherence protein C
VTALLVATGVFLLIASRHPRALSIGDYLGSPNPEQVRPFRLPPAGPAVAGAAFGIVAAMALDPSNIASLSVIGILGGTVVGRAVRSTARERRSARLAQELPTVADTIALHVLAGESVATAISRFVAASRGVAADEFEAVLDSDLGFEESLRRAARDTVYPEAARLYDLLGHAHRTGGGLSDALTALAADYRALLTRELTAEGGRRALTTYGPILALMIPVTLLFLMYPTLAGLNALSQP